MAQYIIKIIRGDSTGRLRFSSGPTLVNTTCYWDSEKVIPAADYSGCSATTMQSKLNSAGQAREGIFIPNVPSFRGIFIHMGRPSFSSWSDGCIVIAESKLLQIYNAISQKNGQNILVRIQDSE